MPKFVRMVNFYSSAGGGFDTEGDSENFNEILTQLQEKGAEIVDIKGTVGKSEDGAVNMIYIVYEASAPIEIEEPEGIL